MPLPSAKAFALPCTVTATSRRWVDCCPCGRAVNRLTVSGKVLGPNERISAYDALQAVTITPAYLLKMDHEVGSLECGKFADFAVLDESPLEVDPLKIKDIKVWGTVMGGKKFPAPSA